MYSFNLNTDSPTIEDVYTFIDTVSMGVVNEALYRCKAMKNITGDSREDMATLLFIVKLIRELTRARLNNKKMATVEIAIAKIAKSSNDHEFFNKMYKQLTKLCENKNSEIIKNIASVVSIESVTHNLTEGLSEERMSIQINWGNLIIEYNKHCSILRDICGKNIDEKSIINFLATEDCNPDKTIALFKFLNENKLLSCFSKSDSSKDRQKRDFDDVTVLRTQIKHFYENIPCMRKSSPR